jgi:hypothetical protein
MIPWTGDQPVARPLSAQDNTEKTPTDIHAPNGIGTHDPAVRVGKDIYCNIFYYNKYWVLGDIKCV